MHIYNNSQSKRGHEFERDKGVHGEPKGGKGKGTIIQLYYNFEK